MATFTLEEGTLTFALETICALRIRVSRSEMGSLMLISESPALAYQLALTTPGTLPSKAISRILWRARPNWRKVPRARPVNSQRLRWRGGVALRGSFCSAWRAARRSSSLFFASFAVVFSSSYFFAYWATSLSRLSSRWIKAVLATLYLQFLNGNLKPASSDLHFWRVFAVVVMEMLGPRRASPLSYSISDRVRKGRRPARPEHL